MTPLVRISIRAGLRMALVLMLFGILLPRTLLPLAALADTPHPILVDPPRAPLRPASLPPAPLTALALTSVCPAGHYCAYLPQLISLEQSANNRQSAIDLYKEAFVDAAGVAPGWNGSIAGCNPGTTSPAFNDTVLLRINYYREMAGVPKVRGLNSTYNKQDQAAALMMAANQQLNHTPPSSWKCYTQTGYDGSSSSNLAMGVYGPAAISLYMNEEGSLGHRRWVLYPQTQEMGTGDIPGSGGWQTMTNAMKAWDDHVWDARPATRNAFIAWPPATDVPYQVVYPVWSFAIAGADFSNAAVTMTSNGASIPVTVSHPGNGYGENTLAWTACSCSSWPNPGADRAYQVSVKNVLVNGEVHDYAYTVTVIDPNR